MFKIILNFLETKDWEKSLLEILPARKFNQDKNSTSGNDKNDDDDNDESDNNDESSNREDEISESNDFSASNSVENVSDSIKETSENTFTNEES